MLLPGLTLVALIGGGEDDGTGVATAANTKRESIEVAFDWLPLRPVDLGDGLAGDPTNARGGRSVTVSVDEAEQRDVDAGPPPGAWRGLLLDVIPDWPTTVVTKKQRFVAGFVKAGGTWQMARYFTRAVLPCESAGQPPGGFIDWTPGGYMLTAAQIHPGNLPRIEHDAGRDDFAFEEPYDVGVMSATWLAAIGGNPAAKGGWECAELHPVGG